MKRVELSIKKKLASIALLSVELIIALVLFICALIVFAIIAYRIFNLQNEHFDFKVFDWIANYISSPVTSVPKRPTSSGWNNSSVYAPLRSIFQRRRYSHFDEGSLFTARFLKSRIIFTISSNEG